MKRTLSYHLVLVLLSLLAVVGSACQPAPSESPLDSPARSPLSPVSVPFDVAVRPFQLDKPIHAGVTRVTGSGPVGVPIILQDITFAGPLLAFGVIDESGQFELTLGQPLEVGHRVGIALGDLTGTGWERLDFFSDEGFYGDEAFTVPQVGFFFDTCMIRE